MELHVLTDFLSVAKPAASSLRRVYMAEPHLRSAVVNRAARACAFSHYFGFSRAPASVLIALYEAEGAIRTATQLASVASVAPRAIQWHICMIRQALDNEAIDFEDGLGYRLTEVGMADAKEALREMRESLAA